VQSTIKVITPAKEISLATLFELKALLNFAQTDGAFDTGLELMLRRSSGEIAAYCRRVFAEEEVVETFRNFVSSAIFLSRYPVSRIVSISSGSWDIDAESGMLVGAGTSPLVVHYVGGYKLPAEAPQGLRQAALMLSREAYFQTTTQGSAQAQGIKMIAHKESRIVYQNATSSSSTSTTIGSPTSGSAASNSAARRAIGDLLIAYTRFSM
jgi:hypothetical protein